MNDVYKKIFNKKLLSLIFPESITDNFFDMLLGDSKDGAYNIVLTFLESFQNYFKFEFHIIAKKNKCLKCNLTYGLPNVFMKHPAIDIKNIVDSICSSANVKLKNWEIGETSEINEKLHIIPLTVEISKSSRN